MTILVTGATGTIGSEVVKQLAIYDAKVRVALHNPAHADKIKSSEVEIAELDFNKPATLVPALQDVKKLFLLTPVAENMVAITDALVKEAKKAKVQYIVKISAVGADMQPGTTIGRWHRQAENLIKGSGIPFTMVRPNVFMQNFANFYSQTIKAQNTIFAPAGTGQVAFVDARDIAAVSVVALTKKGHERKTYNVTGPEALTYKQAAALLSHATGKDISYADIDDATATKGMKQAGMPAWMIDAFLELGESTRKDYFANVEPTVKQVTGVKPKSFAQFARDYAAAFR